MITTIVSAIKGPMLSVLSGCLGESRKLRWWLWNLAPIQVHMPSYDVPKKNCRASYDMFGSPFFVVR